MQEDYHKFRLVAGQLVDQAKLESQLAESRQQVAGMMFRSADIMLSPRGTLREPFRGMDNVSDRDVELIRAVATYITGISYNIGPSIGEID